MRYACCHHCQDGIHCSGRLHGHPVPCTRFGCDMPAPLVAPVDRCGHCGGFVGGARTPCPSCPAMLCGGCAASPAHPAHDRSPAIVWEAV